MRAQPEGSNYIAGRFVDDASGDPLDSLYPANGEVIARLLTATGETVDAAVGAAARAQGDWARTPAAARGRVLRRAAELLRERNAELAELETLDTGKPLQETLIADAASGADALEFFGGVAASLAGRHIDFGASFAYTRREPLGVCVGIGAWNYPMQIACWKAAPALAAGNAMVFKPSELTPLSALAFAAILTEAGLPDGLFNVVQGRGETGAALTAHPGVAKLSLTGSVATGKRVMAAAADGLKPVTLELGGKSPLIVFDDADVEQAVGAAMLANFYSAGQVCTNGTRVFVQEGIRERFLERLVARTRAMRLGDPLDPETHMGPLVSVAQAEKVLDYLRLGREEGAKVAVGGERRRVQGCERGVFVEPTVFTNVADSMRIAREEIFGPVMCLFGFDTEEEAIGRANDTPFGLAAGVFTRDITRAHRVAARLDAGTLWINAYNLTPVEMPFGGIKQSGIGRENGLAALDFYTREKSVYVEMEGVDSPY